MAGNGERTWSSYPARDRPIAACAALATVAAMSLLVWRIAGDWMWGALAAIGLTAAILRFLLPTRCGIGPGGLVVHHPLSTNRVAWGNVMRINSQEDAVVIGVRLQGGRSRSILVPLGGLTAEQRSEVRTAIDAAVERARSDARQVGGIESVR
jgi:hypothetical protein